MGKRVAKLAIDENGMVVSAKDMDGKPLRYEEGASMIGARITSVPISESAARGVARGCVWRLIGGGWRCV
ncbi:MAG: hypothetical protein GX443_04240 [Deltaproteobacteria bacterium]|nr:hypothetical protein [Deltaproteobacteria bacterium]